MSTLIPRLEMDQLDPAVAEALGPRVRRLGYLGEFFKCAGHVPEVLLAFMRLTDALKEALPDDLTEVVALTVAGLMKNTYERNQHERLCRAQGRPDTWVRDVNALAPDAPSSLSEAERLVQRFAIAVVTRAGQGVRDEFDAVVKTVGPAQAMAILMLVGRYVTHALTVNTLGLAPPVPSIFDEARR